MNKSVNLGRILAVFALVALFALASCNKNGCPNKITEVEQPEHTVDQ